MNLKEKGEIDKLIEKYTHIPTSELLTQVKLPKYHPVSLQPDQQKDLKPKGIIVGKYLFTNDDLTVIRNAHNIIKPKIKDYLYEEPDLFISGLSDPLKLNCINLPIDDPGKLWENAKIEMMKNQQQQQQQVEKSNESNEIKPLMECTQNGEEYSELIANNRFKINQTKVSDNNNNNMKDSIKILTSQNQLNNLNPLKRKIRGRPIRRERRNGITDSFKNDLINYNINNTSSWSALDKYHYNEYPNVVKERKIENLAESTANELLKAIEPEKNSPLPKYLKEGKKISFKNEKELEEQLNSDIMKLHSKKISPEEMEEILNRQKNRQIKQQENKQNEQLKNRQTIITSILQKANNVPILKNNDLSLLSEKHYKMYCMLRSHQILSEALQYIYILFIFIYLYRVMKPDVYLLNSYLNVFASAHKIKESEMILTYFPIYNISPDSMTYHHLIELYSNTGFLERALVLRNAMKNQNIKVLKRTNGILVEKLTEEGHIGESLKILTEVKEKDIGSYPNENHLHLLRRLCKVYI